MDSATPVETSAMFADLVALLLVREHLVVKLSARPHREALEFVGHR